jgi:hypothetical protein
MRTSFLLIAGLLLATGVTSTAKAEMEWGLGFLNSDIPVGVFLKPNEKTTIHAAVDYVSNDLPSSAGNATIETEVAFAAALVWDFWSASNWGFGVAPGVTYRNYSPKSGDSSSLTTIPIQLAGHWNPADMLSLWFSHGLVVAIDSPAVGDSRTDFYTNGNNVTSFGFTVWAP